MERAGRASVVAVALTFTGCYAPEIREGLPCTPEAACPSGLTCQTGGVCLTGPDDAAPAVADLGFGEPVRVAALSGDGNDHDPTASEDLLELYLARPVPETSDDRLHRSTRSSALDPWSAPTLVAELSGASRVDPELSPDGESMLLKEADDIHYTARVDAGAPWAQPTRLAELSGEAGEEPGPISADGLRVVFASDRLGAWALFEATRAGEGDAFGTPVLRLELYSPHDDGNPQLSPDGLQVVFHSDRPGVGSHDLWFARRNSVDDPFDPPALIDVVSTAAEEWDPWLSPDGALLLFVRDGDIYQATAR